jgi:mono/diheme cytochrome c family protein
MHRPGPFAGLLLAAGVAAAGDTGGGTAQPPDTRPAEGGVRAVSGAYAYRTYCASCHGTDGRGEGPLAESLRFVPPDLTRIAKRSGGSFPAERVQRVVDGRSPLPGHGGPEMPIWGDAFRNPETGFDDARAREKIRSIVDHLRTLQAR